MPWWCGVEDGTVLMVLQRRDVAGAYGAEALLPCWRKAADVSCEGELRVWMLHLRHSCLPCVQGHVYFLGQEVNDVQGRR
jgi:hypothetical protein